MEIHNKKSGVALTQLSLTLHYSRRVFYHQFSIHVQTFFLYFIVDELPAFIVIGYIFFNLISVFCLNVAVLI